MPRILLANTAISIPPVVEDDWEIPISAAMLLFELDFDLVVHTIDDHVAVVTREDLLGGERGFMTSVSQRARSSSLEEALEYPLIVMTPIGESILSEVEPVPDATFLIGGFRVGELEPAIHRKANYRVTLGPNLMTVPEVIEAILRNWQQ